MARTTIILIVMWIRPAAFVIDIAMGCMVVRSAMPPSEPGSPGARTSASQPPTWRPHREAHPEQSGRQPDRTVSACKILDRRRLRGTRQNSRRSERLHCLDHFAYHAEELLALARRHGIEAATLLLDTELLQELQQHPVPLHRTVVAFLVMAVPGVAGQNHNAISPVTVGLEHELGIHPSAAHYANDANVRRVDHPTPPSPGRRRFPIPRS